MPDAAFVGRERELADLTGWLEEARAGAGRVVLLAGEPGIGKTRTAEELAALAREQGVRVLWGRCYEGEGAPAFWPWVQVLRACARDLDPETLTSAMGPGAAEIAALVPECRPSGMAAAPLPGAAPGGADADPGRRFRLFDAITAFLLALADLSSRPPAL